MSWPRFNGRLWGVLAVAVLVLDALWAGPPQLLISFSGPGGGWHFGTFALGNLNNDPELEIVIPYRSEAGWFLDAFNWTGTRLPGFPYAGDAEINVSPTLHDLDGDGRLEILFTCGPQVIALRANGAVMWSSEVNYANYVPNAGYQVATNGFFWSETGEWVSRLPSTATFSSQFMPPIVADVNADGEPEVITAWKIDPDSTSGAQDFNPFINDLWGFGEWGTVGESWSGGVVSLRPANGARQWVYHFHQLVEAGLALGQADLDAAREVYVLNDSDSVVCFDQTRPHGFYGKGMLHGQFGKNQRVLSGSYQQGIDLYTVDLDGDARAEVLVPMTQLKPIWQPSDTILDDDGAILWRGWKESVQFEHRHGWLNHASLIPVNPDRDNHIDVLGFTHSHELTFRYWNGVDLVTHSGWPKQLGEALPTPPIMGDVDGDGAEEIVVGTYRPAEESSDGYLYVFGLDGAEKHRVSISGGVKHIPALADVNADASLDVVVRSLTGKIYVYNFGAGAGARVSWATHRGNMRRDGKWSVDLFPPGTPKVTGKTSGYRWARLKWSNPATNAVDGFRIYRASAPEGPFVHLVTLLPDAREYADTGLELGEQYIYEVAVITGNHEIRSAPVAVLSCLNSNLLCNSGFEENDNSHWDKWFMGSLGWESIKSDAQVAHQGRQSMAVTLHDHPSQSSIKQYNQYGIPDASIPVAPETLYSFGGFFRSAGITPAAEHWLEWNPTSTADHPEPPPELPYPNYFTPLFAPGTRASGWVYANRTFVMPAGIYAVDLRHRFEVPEPATGTIHLDDLFFRPLPPLDSARWIDVIRFQSIWRYFVGAAPGNWMSPACNDGAWAVGRAKFGAGAARDVTTQLPPRNPAYHFRTQFVLTNAAAEELLLAATCTDDYGGTIYPVELWLNGQSLTATGMEVTSPQGNDVKYFDLAPLIPALRAGTNVLAFKISNTWGDWDDVAFDLNLKTIPSQASPAAASLSVVSSTVPSLRLNLAKSPPTCWRLESCDRYYPGVDWQPMMVVTSTAGNVTITDTGQNGRQPPSQVPSRLYRLRPY